MKMTKTGLVILFGICVAKCLAMTQSELEEFSNFLELTSRLDINVKSKGPEDDYDEDELVSDHAWEDSGKFEGDLILNERQRRLLVADIAEGLSRNGLQDSTKRWPNNEVIYYIQREHFSSGQVQAILAGIDDLAQVSCVKFKPYRKGDQDAVVIQGSRRGCFSQVGYQGGYQVLNLSGRHPVGRGCFRHGTVVHELLHSLGFYHMQSSPDRDDYIDVHWQNIIKPARHNFRKYNSFAVSDFGVGYDYESVLHYSRKAFSSNGQDTLVPKQPGAQIGQRVGLSQKDIQKLNRMYCDIDLNDPNNVDDDNKSKKPVVIKKTSKNKPFDGHGIGYHQGKTVVIKLDPTTVELYRLPTLGKLHTFDYINKPAQALPFALTDKSTREKEIIDKSSTKQLANIEEYYKPTSKSIDNAINGKARYIDNIDNRNEISVATASDDQTAFKLVDDEKQEDEPSIYNQKQLNNFSEKIKSGVSDIYKQLTNFAQPKPDAAHAEFISMLPELQIKDHNYYSREHLQVETVPFEYQQFFQKQNGQPAHDKNTNLRSFRNPYPSKHNYYDPEVRSLLAHYIPDESKSSELHSGENYSRITDNIPSYAKRYNRNYNYPNLNYYQKAPHIFQEEYK